MRASPGQIALRGKVTMRLNKRCLHCPAEPWLAHDDCVSALVFIGCCKPTQSTVVVQERSANTHTHLLTNGARSRDRDNGDNNDDEGFTPGQSTHSHVKLQCMVARANAPSFNACAQAAAVHLLSDRSCCLGSEMGGSWAMNSRSVGHVSQNCRRLNREQHFFPVL